jgi:sirohydrochlorin ferrochelatase
MTPRLLVVAHGTASPLGSATTAGLVDAVAAARPNVRVELCFLDVVAPRLPDALDDSPTVVVPLLLSTGFHVQTDIPAVAAEYPNVRVARHLGPHRLLVDALVDRLPWAAPGPAATTILVGASSSRPEAAGELTETARLLGQRLGQSVHIVTIGPDLRSALAALDQPIRVATYLLAEGAFVRTLLEAAAGLGSVAAPLGVHRALVQLVWTRYDESLH